MKILILHASAGAGHKRAAEALAKAFRMEQPEAEVRVCDTLDFTPAVFRKSYATGYLDIVRKAPELWGYMFSQTDKKALLPSRRHIRALFNEINAIEFRKFYHAFDPDITVCTHFLPLEILSRKRPRRMGGAPLFCVVTDFAVHALWILENVACYYVATEEARRQILRRGQPASRIVLSGIPIDPVFADRMPAAAARKQLGLVENRPTLLLLSGGFGVGPTVELIRSMSAMKTPCQLLVVAGANEKMKKEAEAGATQLSFPVRVFGFVNTIHELMDAADLIISKPGGLTASEVLAKGKALLVIDPIPGQEQRNCEYLLEAGAAARLYEPEDAPHKIEALLADPERLRAMQAHAAAVGHPHAAREIAQDVLRRSE